VTHLVSSCIECHIELTVTGQYYCLKTKTVFIIIIIVIIIYYSTGVCLVIIADELLKKLVANKRPTQRFIVKFIIYIHTRCAYIPTYTRQSQLLQLISFNTFIRIDHFANRTAIRFFFTTFS